jgi:hypothetical protein
MFFLLKPRTLSPQTTHLFLPKPRTLSPQTTQRPSPQTTHRLAFHSSPQDEAHAPSTRRAIARKGGVCWWKAATRLTPVASTTRRQRCAAWGSLSLCRVEPPCLACVAGMVAWYGNRRACQTAGATMGVQDSRVRAGTLGTVRMGCVRPGKGVSETRDVGTGVSRVPQHPRVLHCRDA